MANHICGVCGGKIGSDQDAIFINGDNYEHEDPQYCIDGLKELLRECADGLFFFTDEPKWKLKERIQVAIGKKAYA